MARTLERLWGSPALRSGCDSRVPLRSNAEGSPSVIAQASVGSKPAAVRKDRLVSSLLVDCNARGECREDYILKTCVLTTLVAAFLRRGAETVRLAHNQEAVGGCVGPYPRSDESDLRYRCAPRGTTGPISLRVTVRLRPQRPTIRSRLAVRTRAFEALRRGWLHGALPTQRDAPAAPARRRSPSSGTGTARGASPLVRTPALQADRGEFDPLAPYRRRRSPTGGDATGHDGLVALGSLIRSPRCVRSAGDPLPGRSSACAERSARAREAAGSNPAVQTLLCIAVLALW